jgi:Icc-related predicted phosphoesterase
MRVHVFSDLHLEFGPLELSADVRFGRLADVVLLAGDIHTKRRGPRWAAQTFTQPVAIILGNHEAYGDSLTACIAAHRKSAEDASQARANPVRALERETWSLTAADGTPVRIIAATLWTDFAFFGAARQADVMHDAHLRMNDFRMIRLPDALRDESRRLEPMDLLRIHQESRFYIESVLAVPFDGVSIVMTHHAPSGRSIAAEYRDDPITAAYASDLEALIEQTQPLLWVHGHTHRSFDYRIGATRVVCNPRGYYGSDLNPEFDPELVVDLSG